MLGIDPRHDQRPYRGYMGPAPPYGISNGEQGLKTLSDQKSPAEPLTAGHVQAQPCVPDNDLLSQTFGIPPFEDPVDEPIATHEAARETYQAQQDLPNPKGHWLNPRMGKVVLAVFIILIAIILGLATALAIVGIRYNHRAMPQHDPVTAASTRVLSSMHSVTVQTSLITTTELASTQHHTIFVTQTQSSDATLIPTSASSPLDVIRACVVLFRELCTEPAIQKIPEFGACETLFFFFCSGQEAQTCAPQREYCSSIEQPFPPTPNTTPVLTDRSQQKPRATSLGTNV